MEGCCRRHVWPVESPHVDLELEGGYDRNVDIPRLLFNTDAPGVEVKGKVEEEIHWNHLVLHCPVHPHLYLLDVVLHQGGKFSY